MLKGIALFLTKLQLTFKISERAMSALLIFLGTIFSFLSNIIKHPLLIELHHILPKTMWKIKNVTGMRAEGIIDYVVCSKCHSLYSMADCSVMKNNKRVFIYKLCTHIEYPNHLHHSGRLKCNTPLMKQVKISGKPKLGPKKFVNIIALLIPSKN